MMDIQHTRIAIGLVILMIFLVGALWIDAEEPERTWVRDFAEILDVQAAE